MKRYITSNPEIMGGQPCIVGTRIPVSLILMRLKQGMTLKGIQEDYHWVPLKRLRERWRNLLTKSTMRPMVSKTSKPKLLLDENCRPRKRFPKLNSLYDVKHVAEDLHKSGLKDREVYELAKEQGRLVVTYNDKDFLPFADKSEDSGVIGVSPNLSTAQIDTKLVALLRKSNRKSLYAAFHYISGETRV